MNKKPNNELMVELTKMAIEQVTSLLAGEARRFAERLPEEIGGKEALIAFAESIDSTNSKMYPRDRKANDA